MCSARKSALIGDAVWDQDTLLPQIAVGVQYKRADKGAVIRAVGGKQTAERRFLRLRHQGVLAQSLVLDATVRFTKANQFGLLGFGGDKRRRTAARSSRGRRGCSSRATCSSAANIAPSPTIWASRARTTPTTLFAAWAVAPHLSLTAAYADLGDIATVEESARRCSCRSRASF